VGSSHQGGLDGYDWIGIYVDYLIVGGLGYIVFWAEDKVSSFTCLKYQQSHRDKMSLILSHSKVLFNINSDFTTNKPRRNKPTILLM
jgi:hypothetical protein